MAAGDGNGDGHGAQRCDACGAENPAGSRYCGRCGHELGGRHCPACGHENPAGHAFCNQCGQALEATPGTDDESTSGPRAPELIREAASSAPVPAGERKQVTIVFADIKGSMDLAEQTDPERWRQIMQRFFALLSDGVEEFGGTVDKFTGDGIMAVFGAPVALEDHAQRACYAALRMGELVREYAADLRREQGLSFAVRIGINSGEVVAGQIGTGAEGDGSYTAIGHTVGLAQRMEALAEPGKAYVAEGTARLAEGFLDFTDLGEFDVKGASRPVRVFELRGIGAARSRLDLARERGFSRFVGRDSELGTLEDALIAAEQGHAGVVGVVADAGVGKSRLCDEFAERCRARGIHVYEAQCQSHGRTVPLMPVLQMMRGYFGISEDDDERLAREKVAGRALLLEPALADRLPLIFDFLGIPDPQRPVPQMSPDARSRALEGVVRTLVAAPSREETVVNLIEDLHWIDQGSEQFLGALLDAMPETPTLVLLNYRPEYEARWLGQYEHFQPMPLAPLGPEDTASLLADLVGDDPSLDGLAELLHERTGGNPFFVEEVVRGLVEDSQLAGEPGAYRLVGRIDEMRVPASVQTVLAARIDRIMPEAKATLQAASVIGKEVSQRTLERVADAIGVGELGAAIDELIAADFIYEAELYPERVLAFRHPLTREVAYGSQLSERRAATHAATAVALAELNPSRHDELAALIAQHHEQGDDALEAARWYARAAYWAGHNQPRDALALWQKVTELSDRLPDSEESIGLRISSRILQLDAGWRLGMEEERAGALVEEAHELAQRAGDLRSQALLQLVGYARPGLPHSADEWIAAAAKANELADRSGDVALRVATRAAGGYAPLAAGRIDLLERWCEEAFELAAGDGGAGAGIIITCPIAWAHMGLGMVARERDRLEEAEHRFRQSIAMAEDHDDAETASWARGNLVTVLTRIGKTDEAMGIARRNCELVDRLGDVFSRVWALSYLGWARAAKGDGAAAVEATELAIRTYNEAMPAGGEAESWRLAIHTKALFAAGRFADARDAARRSAELSREQGLILWLPSALKSLAEAQIALGDDDAMATLDDAAAAAAEVGSSLAAREIEDVRTKLAERA